MSNIREMTDVRELDPVEMDGVEGGYFVADGYCGTFVPNLPYRLPPPPSPSPIVSMVNVLPPGLAAASAIGSGF
jgi:hypothetical protein